METGRVFGIVLVSIVIASNVIFSFGDDLIRLSGFVLLIGIFMIVMWRNKKVGNKKGK